MFNLSLYLRRTGEVIRAIVRSFTFVAHQWSATLGTLGYESNLFAKHKTCCRIHACNLGNDFTALLDIHHITNVEVELFNDIGIMQRCALHHSPRQLHRVEIGNRGNNTSAANLVCDLVKTCHSTLGLEFIRYCPTWRLGRVPKILLLTQGIDLKHNTVGGKRQVLAFHIHSVNESKHLVYGVAFASGIGDFEPPLLGCLKILVMPLGGQILT